MVMKKIVAFCIAVSASLGTFAAAYVPQTEKSWFFAGERYGISNIDTDGEIFVGVNEGKIAVSDDFENWRVHAEFDDVAAATYLSGKFRAFAKDYTYISEDGENWEKVQNNLELIPDKDKIIKNNGSVVLFARSEDWSQAGTYQSFDGISWKRVENIPDGIAMNIVNGKIIFESNGYMRGIYYSDTGESFTCLNIDGYDNSHSVFRMAYDGSKYVLYDYWREIPESTEENRLLYRYTSEDLVNWNAEIVPETGAGTVDRYGWIEPSGSIVEINGELNSFSQNGYNFVYRNGGWEKGDYYGITAAVGGDGAYIDDFVYYNFTDYGVFMWSTSHDSAFIKNDGEMLLYNGREKNVSGIFCDGKKFVAQRWGADWQWESENGKDWVKVEPNEDFIRHNTAASDGKSSFESELIERGSWRYYYENKNITGTLIEADGSVKRIAFENTGSSDCVAAFGGNGFYLMRALGGTNDYWISYDGITRDEYIDIGAPGAARNLYANGSNFIVTTQAGIQYVGDMAQFEKIPPKNAIRIKLGDEYLSFENAPIIENGRTLASMRFIFEKMGVKVDWSDSARVAFVSYGEDFGNLIEIPIGSNTVTVNGEEKTIDTQARIVGGRTMLPLRFIAEEMGYTVNYDKDANIAEIVR